MPRALRVSLVVFLVASLALGLTVQFQPAHFQVVRSAEIAAPPQVVFPLIDDFHQWTRWSPWEKLDPNLQRTYEGPSAGPGAIYAWQGNEDIGSGRMTILAEQPGEWVEIELEFFEPFAATNQVRFELTPSETGTLVRWTMDGENGFLGKAISLVMDMDPMVGGSFEQGLADLGAAAREDSAIATP